MDRIRSSTLPITVVSGDIGRGATPSRRQRLDRMNACYRLLVNRPAFPGFALLLGVCLLARGLMATDWTISLSGAGPLRLGMSLDATRRILGDSKARLAGNEPHVPLNDCAYLDTKRTPTGIGLMFANGRLVRIDVFEGSTKTVSGAGIGDSEDRITQLYRGRIKSEPHVYVDDGHYLNYVPGGRSKLGIVFETDGRRVTSFRVGTLTAIALVEGCS